MAGSAPQTSPAALRGFYGGSIPRPNASTHHADGRTRIRRETSEISGVRMGAAGRAGRVRPATALARLSAVRARRGPRPVAPLRQPKDDHQTAPRPNTRQTPQPMGGRGVCGAGSNRRNEGSDTRRLDPDTDRIGPGTLMA